MDTCDSPIALGSILFTMVEPHAGHVVDYNRWYERDHFYAGCMIGPYNFAGGRFVATKPLKALRYPAVSPITPDPSIGSYLAIYYVLAGHHAEWNRWSYRQVKVLHNQGRMFEERDHIHTQLYTFDWDVRRDADGVPPELALDRRFPGLAVVIGEASASRDELDAWYRAQPLPAPSAAMCLSFSPMPLQVDVPGVPKAEGEDRRFLHLYFLDDDPASAWSSGFAAHGDALAASGLGRVLFASPFIPTIPGTDTYTDQL